MAGEVVANNQDAIDAPESINADSYANWLFKLKPANAADVAALMDEAVRATLPDQQTAVQVNADMAYWAEHRDEIGNRWYAWQAQ